MASAEHGRGVHTQRGSRRHTTMTFEGVRPVLHMPFGRQSGEPLVETELVALVETMIGHGVDGLVVLGLASEAWAITETERDRIIDSVVGACAGRIPLVVGLEGSTEVACDRARRAAARGAAGLMVLPPSQATSTGAIVTHFAAVADAGGLPVLMQDTPRVTGVVLDVPTIVAARRAHSLVRALKVEVPGAGEKVSAVHDAGIEVVAGWGGLAYLEQVERGAVGCMPGCDLGPALLAIDRSVRRGDHQQALRSYRDILPLLAFETQSLELLLLSAKRHLYRSGIFTTETMRAPARQLDTRESATLDDLLDELAKLGVPGFGGSDTVVAS
ncbi:MAG: dihydrodipicolinate synthase family protein [Chloroflexota bacterium]